MCADIPNAFIQAEMPDISDGKEWVTMKITGVLVDMLVQLSPEIYGPYVVFEKQCKVIYVQVLKARYTECYKPHCYGITSSDKNWRKRVLNSTHMTPAWVT